MGRGGEWTSDGGEFFNQGDVLRILKVPIGKGFLRLFRISFVRRLYSDRLSSESKVLTYSMKNKYKATKAKMFCNSFIFDCQLNDT